MGVVIPNDKVTTKPTLSPTGEKKIFGDRDELDNRAINRKRQYYLGNHSRDIAKIINENWTKESGLFASCIYENGVKYMKQPSEPHVTDSGLAREHLRSGYESLWGLYLAGRDESIEKCGEIEMTINKYEEITLGDLLTLKGCIYPDILSAIFNGAHNGNNGTEKQEIKIKQYDGKEYLVIHKSMKYREQQLRFGNHEMMVELARVKKLVDDQAIRGFVRDYVKQ